MLSIISVRMRGDSLQKDTWTPREILCVPFTDTSIASEMDATPQEKDIIFPPIRWKYEKMVSMWALPESRVYSVCSGKAIVRRHDSAAGILHAVYQVSWIFCAALEKISEAFLGWNQVDDGRMDASRRGRAYLARQYASVILSEILPAGCQGIFTFPSRDQSWWAPAVARPLVRDGSFETGMYLFIGDPMRSYEIIEDHRKLSDENTFLDIETI